MKVILPHFFLHLTLGEHGADEAAVAMLNSRGTAVTAEVRCCA